MRAHVRPGSSQYERDSPNARLATFCAGLRASGEGRNRTGDTTVFSRVLYRLSYLAAAPQSTEVPDESGAHTDTRPLAREGWQISSAVVM